MTMVKKKIEKEDVVEEADRSEGSRAKALDVALKSLSKKFTQKD